MPTNDAYFMQRKPQKADAFLFASLFIYANVSLE